MFGHIPFSAFTFAAAEIGIPELRLAETGNDAGIIGAAMLEQYGIDKRKQ